MIHRDVRPVRRNGSEFLARERARHAFDLRIHLWEIAADVTAEDRARQAGGAGLIGIGHRGMRMLFEFELLRPAVIDRIPQAMQRAHARIATP